MQNNEATQQFPSYVMPEAAKGVPISEALPGAVYLVFLSSRFLKTREKFTNWDNLVCLSLYTFLGQSHLRLLLQKKTIYIYFYKILSFVKVNTDGSDLKKYTK